MSSRSRLYLALALLTVSAACNLLGPGRSPKVPPPIEAPNPKLELPAPEKAAEPEPLPPPPEIEGASLPEPGPAPPLADEALPPPPPKPIQASGGGTTRSVGPDPDPSRSAPEEKVEPSPVPQLTELLPEEKRWEYGQEVDRRLQNINQIIEELEKRPLKEEQMRLLDRVRVFVRQTTESRAGDLVTARNLSERAELLAEELERTTR
jgi:hypothetical protein